MDVIRKYRKYLKNKMTIRLWQLFCLIQRESKIQNYLKSNDTKKLQLGSGENILDGWLNTDLLPLDPRIVYLDITKEFPFKDDTFDYIFSEHMIEHMSYDHGYFSLQECYRILKPGGIIRIATPDIHFLLDLFGKKNDLQKEYIKWSIDNYTSGKIYNEVFVLNNFVRNWGHTFIYDFDILKSTLEKIGFRTIKCEIAKSEHEYLRGLECHISKIPEKFNELETMIIEGKK